jgi:hypothetical protein
MKKNGLCVPDPKKLLDEKDHDYLMGQSAWHFCPVSPANHSSAPGPEGKQLTVWSLQGQG